MNKTIITLFSLILIARVHAQTFEWAKSFGGTAYDFAACIAIDNSGNVFTTGYFKGTVDFDPGAGTSYLTSVGDFDVYIQKLDANGNFLWAKSYGGINSDQGHSIAVDASGNVYTKGFFEGTVDFDPGAGTSNLTPVGSGDIFVQKLDASGNFLWAKAFDCGSIVTGRTITVDSSENVYITGHFKGTVDFDPGTGTSNLTSVGSRDIFVQKLDANGNFLWAKAFGSTSDDHGNAVAVDASGNVYLTGLFQGTIDFDPGAGTSNLTSVGSWDIFVQKLDASGNFLWAKAFGGTSYDSGRSITVDASGNVYLTGNFQGTVDFDPGAGTSNLTSAGSAGYDDVFVQKLDASGNFLWAKAFGGAISDSGISITVDASGNVYTTGIFEGTVDFDPGAGTFNLTSAGLWDIFVHNLDASGNFLWAKTFGDTADDFGNSITIDASGNVYTAGIFEGTVDFDPGGGINNFTSAGSNDVFLLKMSQFTPIVGIEENRFGERFAVYPNPTYGNFTINLGDTYENVQILITDVSGKVIQSHNITQTQTLNLKIEKSAGIYLVSIQAKNKLAHIRLIKE